MRFLGTKFKFWSWPIERNPGGHAPFGLSLVLSLPSSAYPTIVTTEETSEIYKGVCTDLWISHWTMGNEWCVKEKRKCEKGKEKQRENWEFREEKLNCDFTEWIEIQYISLIYKWIYTHKIGSRTF